MIARITSGKKGLAKYLEIGKKEDSKYLRMERDKVTVLYGNLKKFEKIENFLNEEKNYVDNYLHLTLSFSSDDMLKLSEYKNEQEVYKDLVQQYLNYYTCGYNLDCVEAYAELHYPKIKIENGAKKYSHIHIGICLYDMATNTKLRPPFTKSTYYPNILQTLCNKKYNFDNPRDKPRETRNLTSKVGRRRKKVIKTLKNIKNYDELLYELNKNNVHYKEIKTRKNQYIKIINHDNGNSINIRGKKFEYLEKKILNKNYINNEKKSYKDLENELNEFYKIKSLDIENRISKTNKKRLESKMINSVVNDIVESKNKLINDFFQNEISYNLKDNSKNTENMSYKNKDIIIEDKGNKIISTSHSKNLSDNIIIMLDIVEKKGWDIEKLNITGNNDFKQELLFQIEARKTRSSHFENIKNITIDRPATELEQEIFNLNEKKALKKIEADKNEEFNISDIKLNLLAESVLDYAQDRYSIDKNDYIVIDNKIKNIHNKQKPKSCIDFFTKEIKENVKEAFNICKNLYINQLNNFINNTDKENEYFIENNKNIDIQKRQNELEYFFNKKRENILHVYKISKEILGENFKQKINVLGIYTPEEYIRENLVIDDELDMEDFHQDYDNHKDDKIRMIL